MSRNSSSFYYFQQESGVGLNEVMSENMTLDERLREDQDEFPGLQKLPSGSRKLSNSRIPTDLSDSTESDGEKQTK